jgi:hypothetical protein
MERYQLFVLGEHNFATAKTDVQVSLSSRRIFDEFRIDLFSRERFNGLYYIVPCTIDGVARRCALPRKGQADSDDYGLQYLRENGAKLSTAWLWRPRGTRFALSAAFAALEPSSGSLSASFGPQYGHLVTLGLDLGVPLFDTAFYTRESRRSGGSYLRWTGALGLGLEENLSVGSVRDGRGDPLPEQDSIHFQDTTVNGQTSLSYRDNVLSLRGELGRTFGPDALNLRQVFSPYRTYLLGTGSAINRVNVPLAGSQSLFRYSVGDWMYRMTADYRRPLIRDVGARVTVLFIESVDFEAVFGRGGVAEGDEFGSVTVVDSVSAAVRVNMDIKGFKIFPALAVGQVLGERQLGLFAEISTTVGARGIGRCGQDTPAAAEGHRNGPCSLRHRCAGCSGRDS